jgi:superfamily I DNA and/or RNA helicase
MGHRIELDKENQAILLYSSKKYTWEERIMAITAMYQAHYYGNFSGYDIYFKGADKKLFYKAENVRILKKIASIDISKYDVYVNGKIVRATGLDKFENDYYRVYSGETTIFTDNIKLKSNKYKDVFLYYEKLADYAGKIAEENSPLYYLSKNYKRITSSSNSILFDYLRGETHSIDDVGSILVPFDFNQSQILAMDTAFKNKISVIEGPPGTGKTQTILNLIANIIYRGQNCAIVSNNNTAIDNVYEKLTEEKLSFLAAPLGKQANVEQFFENIQNSELISFLKQEVDLNKSDYNTRIAHLSAQMKTIQDVEVETSILKSQLIELENESRHSEILSNETIIINQKLKASDYINFIARLEKPKKLGFIERIKYSVKFKLKVAKQDINLLLINAEHLYYKKKISELKKKIEYNNKFLTSHSKQTIAVELKSLCRQVFEKYIRIHYQNYDLKEFNKQSYKNDFYNFLIRYPVILSTSQSLLNNAPRGFTFDYLIIDEASQGDLLSSVLAMNCAKKLIVVGDSRQLQQIEEERLFSESERLAKEYDIPIQYRYEANSILQSIKQAVINVPTTLLKEHYRCAPDIINFCNKIFYDGELVAMTKNCGKHIEIIKTVPGNHARKNPNGRGLYNQREIDEIENIIQLSKSENIGIITPFRYQANLINQKYVTNRIEADTIHKFQGKQKEEIILSFVVNAVDKSSDNIENRLYDFVTNEKLLNVEISRGKNKVTAIVSDKVYDSSNNVINHFIKYAEYLYGSSVTKESTVTSVFDYLYTDYKNILVSKYKQNPNKYQTEILMSNIIDQILQKYRYIGYSMHTRLKKLVKVFDEFSEEEKKYILHPWTHVDFLFYNKVSKEKLFVLEVDGIRYHEQSKKQTKHDEIKDRILCANNIPIHRFKTNESNEENRLNAIIENFSI